MGLDPTNHRIFLASANCGRRPQAAGARAVLPGTFAVFVVEGAASGR
jgi:hypothetical protein